MDGEGKPGARGLGELNESSLHARLKALYMDELVSVAGPLAHPRFEVVVTNTATKITTPPVGPL